MADDNFDYTRFELGFVLLAFFSKFVLHTDYYIFASMITSVALVIKFFSFRFLRYPLFAMIFYVMNWYPLHEYTQIRAAIAISILFLSVEYIFQKRLIIFVGLSILAAFFHSSVIMVSGILFLAYQVRTRSLLAGFIIVCGTASVAPFLFVLGLPYLTQLNPLLPAYLENVGAENLPNFLSGANILTVLFLVFVAFSGTLNNERRRTFFLISCAGLAVFVGFSGIPVLAHRLKEALLVFMTFIAFEYPVNWRTVPQTLAATALSAWVLYSSVNDLFGAH